MKKIINKCNIYNLILFFILISTSIIIPLKQLGDPDMFWHIQTGEFIFNNLKIPYSDIFTYYGIENNLFWTAHEWLSDLIFYLIYSFGGYKLLRLFPSVIMLITGIFAINMTKWSDKNNIFSYISYFIMLFTLAIFSEVRPHMFSFLLFTVEVLLLENYKRKNINNLIWFLPMISMLWANLHGGSSSLSYIIIIFYLIFSIKGFKLGKLTVDKIETNRLKKLFLVLVATISTICINPYGFHMVLYPYINMLDSTMLVSIVEWQSPNFNTPEGILIYCIIMYISCLLILSKDKISLLEITLYGAFIFLSLKSIRQISYCVIALLPLLLNKPVEFVKINKDDTKNILNMIVIVFTCLFLLFFTGIKLNEEDLDLQLYPSEKAMTTIEEINPKRMLNNYDWGGYFIKEYANTEIKPFIDGRADIFSKVSLPNYSKIYYMSPGWNEIIEDYKFDTIVMKPDTPFVNELLKTPDWKEYYKDNTAQIIIKEK